MVRNWRRDEPDRSDEVTTMYFGALVIGDWLINRRALR